MCLTEEWDVCEIFWFEKEVIFAELLRDMHDPFSRHYIITVKCLLQYSAN